MPSDTRDMSTNDAASGPPPPNKDPSNLQTQLANVSIDDTTRDGPETHDGNPESSDEDPSKVQTQLPNASIDDITRDGTGNPTPSSSKTVFPRKQGVAGIAPARSPFLSRGTQDTVITSRPQTPVHGTSVNPSTPTPPNSSTVHARLSPSHSTVAIAAASGIQNVDGTDTGNIRDEVAALASIRRLPAQKAIAQQTGVSRPVRQVPRTTENQDFSPASFGAQAAADDYAIAENMAEATGEEFSSRPSFTSSFARVPDCQRRELCDRRVEKRPRLQGFTLDDTRLGTVNEWKTTAVDGMALTRYVLTPDVFNRRDVQRIRMLFDKDPNSARDIWSRKKQQREWFEIPATLQCDRTFARDPLECYYLEMLNELLRTDRFDEARENPPLLQDPLFPRWWCAFRLRSDWLREGWYRHHSFAILPHDDLEVQQWDYYTLRGEYPLVPQKFKELEIPPALPVPTPPVVWYHHWEMVRGGHPTPRVKLLCELVYDEMALLAIASWYNEMVHGNRMFILTPLAIQRLQSIAGVRRIVPGVATADIFQLMTAARSVHSDLWNEMRFSDRNLSVSFFVDSARGHIDPAEGDIGGRVVHVSTRSRRIHDDLRQTRRMEERNTSVLRLHFYQNEINQVPGLIDIARQQQWLIQRGVSVSNVLRNLIYMISDLSNQVSNLNTEVEELRSQIQQPPSEDHGPMF